MAKRANMTGERQQLHRESSLSKWAISFRDVKNNQRSIYEDHVIRLLSRKIFPLQNLGEVRITRFRGNTKSPSVVNITIHTNRSSMLVGENGKLFEIFKKRVEKAVNHEDIKSPSKIGFEIVNITNSHTNIYLLANQLVSKISAEVQRDVNGLVNSMLELPEKYSNVRGVFIRMKGIRHGTMASIDKRQTGIMNTQSICCDVREITHQAQTKRGIIGVKVIINYGPMSNKNGTHGRNNERQSERSNNYRRAR